MSLTTAVPTTPVAQQVLRGYYADVVGRYWGRPADPAEIERAVREDPSDDLVAPTGLLVIAMAGDEPVGCGGVRLLPDGIAELTRVYVSAAERRGGLATRIVRYLERYAAVHGRNLIRLDTRSDLVEARALYARLGYREVEPFNSEPYAEHWFEKQI